MPHTRLYGGWWKNGQGEAFGGEALENPVRVREKPSHGGRLLVSRSHGHQPAHGEQAVIPLGSSLKFCLIATGWADSYVRQGTTMEWDTGAGHAVLKGAGGSCVDVGTGKPLLYGKSQEDYKNPPFEARGMP